MTETGSHKILIVEDEGVVALDIEARLKRLGYNTVDTACFGDEAVKKAAKLAPDLVLMDIKLRGDMDGTEAARQIRDRFNIPVVYVTAYSDEAILKSAKASEPYGYIVKPFGNRELRATVEMALYRHKTEKALRQAEQKYRTVVETALDGLSIADAQ
ncbi:MAG: response regulator, partial [Planctomycetota bacterium]